MAEENNSGAPVNSPALFSWEASEYIEHERSPGWYIILGAVSIGLLILLTLVLREWLSALTLVVMVIAIVVFARRKPRVLHYSLSETGITIDEKIYPYNDFRSFAVVQNKSFKSIELDPLKRFMPRISMFLDPEDEAPAIEILEQRLPRNDRDLDPIDRLSHYLKF